MSNKERSIHSLHQARTAHIRWVNAIKLLVSGIDVPADTIALSPTDSPFGKWFYDEAMLFSLGTSRMVLEDIEVLLLSMHDKYTKIYPIYYGQKKRSLLGDIMGRKSHASEYEMELSLRYYEEIVLLSDKLKHKLRVLESQLLSIGEEKFADIAKFTQAAPSTPKQQPLNEEPKDSDEAYYYGTRGR
ncbi:MAG: CZB domain-containing protein [Sulfuricurvum sp.]|uniref:CZB domain-containing protein n=1 Tax=Sulfuricurvum sp. TaxID=2025608 RepID=UPI0026153871|nr:CZB domain-containing protein [Sulfuricurvum sp.]MDD2837963.1 CZB domain-containing protein [Sulfuricurvum sp.]MDD3595933.1 CZB domain-containing protein [Sulfuricurvum sp.]